MLGCPALHTPSQERLRATQEFRKAQHTLERGAQAVIQGARSANIYSVLSGVFIRYRLLADGRRQIINFVFPGDMIGLQAMMDEPMTHSVEALTRGELCAFPRDGFPDFVSKDPDLGFDVIWLAAKEEAALEEHLVALGQRNARERIAYLALFLMKRAEGTCMAKSGHRLELSITQGQIADMLGLSLVHTNRSMQQLRREGLVHWNLNEIEIPDPEAVMQYVRFDPDSHAKRRFL